MHFTKFSVDNFYREKLIESSKKEGIVTIDLLTPYQKIHQNNPKTLLYHLDDSHWNPYGVDIAVSATTNLLK